jgi:molecular chaperone IbpA
VKRAELKDGVLSIELEREIPEEMKPRKIAIGGGESVRQLESESGREARNENAKELEAA